MQLVKVMKRRAADPVPVVASSAVEDEIVVAHCDLDLMKFENV